MFYVSGELQLHPLKYLLFDLPTLTVHGTATVYGTVDNLFSVPYL